MTAVDRALKYGVFAIIATLINLASQELMIRVYSGSYALYVAPCWHYDRLDQQILPRQKIHFRLLHVRSDTTSRHSSPML